MASIGTDPGGRRRILFTAPDGARRTVRLGRCSQRSAETFKLHVERLLECRLLSQPMSGDLAGWVRSLDAKMTDRLAAVGLIPRPDSKATMTLGEFLADFTARRVDVKPATKEVWSQTVRNLSEHFGADRALPSVSEGDAEDFKMFLVGQPHQIAAMRKNRP